MLDPFRRRRIFDGVGTALILAQPIDFRLYRIGQIGGGVAQDVAGREGQQGREQDQKAHALLDANQEGPSQGGQVHDFLAWQNRLRLGPLDFVPKRDKDVAWPATKAGARFAQDDEFYL